MSKTRTCPCGASLADAHHNRKRCPECAAKFRLEQDRARSQLVVDAVTCPVCHERFNCITAGHYRNHGFQTADDFKKAFDLNTLKAPSIAAAHSARMTARNPMSGNRHRQQTRAKMSRHRKGKGVGRAGKYERTPEIRARISKGVAAFQLEHPRHALKGYQGQWVDLDVCAPDVWVRSSWEARMLLVLDKHPDVHS